jgi:hypothetical protein
MEPTPSVERRVLVTLGLVVVGSVALVALLNPRLVRFWPFALPDFVQLVTPLFLVALFIERVIEVFVTSWRAQAARKLEQQAAFVGSAKSAADPPTAAQVKVTEYKSRTQRIAFFAGTAIGVMLAALGVRMLGLFVDPAAFKALPLAQQRLFNTADVLLTGAVLGGGADVLHQLVLVFTNFMESSAKWAKERAPSTRRSA